MSLNWPALREYVQAEVLLAIAKRDRGINQWPASNDRIQQLEEQVTRMETAVRESLMEGVSPE